MVASFVVPKMQYMKPKKNIQILFHFAKNFETEKSPTKLYKISRKDCFAATEDINPNSIYAFIRHLDEVYIDGPYR